MRLRPISTESSLTISYHAICVGTHITVVLLSFLWKQKTLNDDVTQILFIKYESILIYVMRYQFTLISDWYHDRIH